MELEHSEITSKIIEAAFRVHNTLGSGFFEKVYENAFCIELSEMGISFLKQYPMDVFYKGRLIGDFVADIFVEETILVELKAVENISPVHETQLVNYLAAAKLETGLLINFGGSVTVRRKFKTYKKKEVD